MAEKFDCQAMLDIYAPIIEHSATSFEFIVPTLQQFQERVLNIQKMFPWLVCCDKSHIMGYAYAGPHRSREAYQWSVELSVYINPQSQRRGAGRALYTALIGILKLQGFYTALAGISLPNEVSVGFHEAFGFTPVGIYQNVGYKFRRWHSVGWWEYPLKTYDADPDQPAKVGSIQDTKQWKRILEHSITMIKTDD